MKKGYLNFIHGLVLLISLLAAAGGSWIIAAPQPVLDPNDAAQLKNLAFGVAGGTSLVIRSRHVETVVRSAAGKSSQFGYAQEGGAMPEILWLRLHNTGSEPRSSCAIQLRAPMDVSRYNSVLIWVRALKSDQRIILTMQDRNWKDATHPQAISSYFPLWGLPENEIIQVVIPFKALRTRSKMDLAHVSQLGFQFGRETTGNEEGNIVEVLGIAFVHQPEKPSKILFVDLSGTIQKHPSVPLQVIAPAPTPYPKPVFSTRKQIVRRTKLPSSKEGRINFAMHPTYFGPISNGVMAFRSPSNESQPIGVLEEGKAYLGLRSQKIDKVTWFLLDIDEKTTGWVPSIDVEFAVPKIH